MSRLIAALDRLTRAVLLLVDVESERTSEGLNIETWRYVQNQRAKIERALDAG